MGSGPALWAWRFCWGSKGPLIHLPETGRAGHALKSRVVSRCRAGGSSRTNPASAVCGATGTPPTLFGPCACLSNWRLSLARTQGIGERQPRLVRPAEQAVRAFRLAGEHAPGAFLVFVEPFKDEAS